MSKRPHLYFILIPLLLLQAVKCWGLEPEPSKWNHLPIDKNFAGMGYAYTEADIFIDPAMRLDNVEMELHTWAAKYIRTFELFEKTARVDFTQGYQTGEWTGLVDGTPASTKRNGLSDSFVRFAVNLYGAPPLKGKNFVEYRQKTRKETIVGMGLAIRLPTGDYMEDKLINLGKNRYAFRPQIGIVHTAGKWSVGAGSEVAFYTENDEFFSGNTLDQDPLYLLYSHLVYTFRPGLWTSASVGYDYGGEKSINGVDKDDNKQDIGWAFSLAYPLNRTTGVKLTYIGTRTQEDTGFDSNTLTGSLSFLW